MSQSVSEKIYEAFFANLAQLEEIKPETIEDLKALYAADHMADGHRLARLVQEMEKRYAQAENADR